MLDDEGCAMDTANLTLSNAVAYGLLPVRYELNSDGPGGAGPPVVTPIHSLFGESSTLVTANGRAAVRRGAAGATVTLPWGPGRGRHRVRDPG